MKKIIYNIQAVVLGIAVLLASCTNDDIMQPSGSTIPEGYMNISFNVESSDMSKVAVRAVDPDGVAIHNLTLFCFNPYGLFITTVKPEYTPTSGTSTSGTIKAQIPEETQIVHFIANQNPNLYQDEDFVNKTEESVMADMEGASGMLIYWSRFEASGNGETFQKELAEQGTIKMIRNQAKISIKNWDTPYITVTGFVTTGIHAFGTVAPYSSTEGFAWPGIEPYVTLPANTALMSDIEDVNTKNEDYIFEHRNTIDNPVSVIIKGVPAGGSEELYYRVALVDANGEQLMIRRNYSYEINISGNLSHGSATFEEALSAPFTNNVWISIDSWVTEVEDDTYKLSVEETGYVLPAERAGSNFTFTYNVERKNGALTAADIAEVSWVGENNVAKHNLVSHTFDAATGVGTVVVELYPMSLDIQKGTLLVKKGRLQRTVEINVIKKQQFTPAWVDTQIYGGQTGEFVTIKFTVPETCPERLFPFSVLVTVNSLDVRSSSGMQLPVIAKGEDGWFGADYPGYGYKYEYVVEAPGVQRLYFHNVLTHKGGDIEDLWLEADFFETLQKKCVFSSHNYAIDLDNMSEYTQNANSDDVIYYKLVPKKRYAHIDFDMVVMDNTNENNPTPMNVGAADEFLLYSKTLDYYRPDEQMPGGLQLECNYYDVDDAVSNSSTNGRMFMFMPMNANAAETGHYNLHLKTNRAVSDDLVRIASNMQGYHSLLPSNNYADYTGNSYRSIIFELATYRAFRFAARINGEGESATGLDEEQVSEIELTYQPGQEIDIEFDVTSFMGTDGACVDPFGEEFEIYIDAPMLQIDNSRLAECKLTADKLFKHPTIEGRFVYLVSSTREAERAFGVGDALVDDETGADQSGERKRLPFRNSKITSAGEITISSNEEKVVYYKKTFEVSNKTIDGSITYNNGVNVPAGSFVAFSRVSDGVRIGSITVTEDGKYKLNLRGEYEFAWTNEEVEFTYTDPNGDAYDFKADNLSAVFHNPDVALELAE